MRRIGWMIAAVTLLAACGAETTDTTDAAVEKPVGGKADENVTEKLCRQSGAAADCDICDVQAWYGDGTCDTFCAKPDPDCGAAPLTSFKASCDFDTDPGLGDTSADLDGSVVRTTKVTIDDIDGLTELQSRQLFDAMLLLDAINGDEDLDVIFDVADDGVFEIHELEVAVGAPNCTTGKRCGNACISRDKTCHLDGGDAYQWVELGLGDTEVGVVFEAGTLAPVARIGDGDLEGCTVTGPRDDGQQDPPTATPQFECSFSQAWLIETSNELEPFMGSERTVTDASELSELEAQQIWIAAVQETFAEDGDDFDIVFDAVDQGEYFLIDLDVDGEKFDWIQWFAGDTEVGAIYDAGTTNLVSVVGDGDIRGCVPAE